MKNLSILLIVIGISICSLYSQTRTIKGRVIADDFEILPQVSIMINDTVEVGRTDANGFFILDIPTSGKKILFMFLGMELTTIELVDKCDKIEVVMMSAIIYDFVSLRRAEMRRKKRYKNIPEIHKQAFNKGIFETESACYHRKFESLYLDKN